MRRVLPLVVILAFWIVFFLPIFQGSTLFDDTIEQFYPAFYFFTESLKRGQIPFFNHHLFSGFPFLNEPQYFALNPFFIIRLAVGLMKNSLYTYNFLVSLNYLAGFLFAYLFLRKRFDDLISLFGATVYIFSMNHITTIVHPHVFDLIPLIPLIFYFLDDKPYISAILLGIGFHTGHPQKPLYLLLSVVIYYLFLTSKDRSKLKTLFLYSVVVVPFVLAYYFQAKDLFSFSERLEWNIKALLESSYHIDKFVSLIIPKFYGSIEEGALYVGGPYHFYMQMSIYFSIPALIFAIYGIIKNRQVLEIKAYTLIVLLMFFLALGDQNPIINIIYSTGIIKGLRDPVRALHILPIFVSILSSYGLKSFLEDRDAKTLLKITVSILIVSFIFLLQKPQIDNSGEILKFFLLLAGTYVLVYALKERNALALSLTALAFIDLYSAGNPYIRRKMDVENYYKPNYISSIKPPYLGYYRINARFERGMVLPRNSGMINGLELTDGYEPLISKFYISFYRFMINRVEGYEKLLSMANVKFYAYEMGFLENKENLPRACLFFNAEVVKDSATFFENLPNYDVKTTLYLQDNPKGYYKEPQPCKSVKILNYDYEKMKLSYESDKPAILYVSLPIYPYWKAKVNGKETKILRANWTFMALEVPKGSNMVEIFYDKKPLIISITLWFVGLFMGLALGLILRR
ncbi:MAG: YfhO family protein [candidate division WOR-3 bacterium]